MNALFPVLFCSVILSIRKASAKIGSNNGRAFENSAIRSRDYLTTIGTIDFSANPNNQSQFNQYGGKPGNNRDLIEERIRVSRQVELAGDNSWIPLTTIKEGSA